VCTFLTHFFFHVGCPSYCFCCKVFPFHQVVSCFSFYFPPFGLQLEIFSFVFVSPSEKVIFLKRILKYCEYFKKLSALTCQDPSNILTSALVYRLALLLLCIVIYILGSSHQHKWAMFTIFNYLCPTFQYRSISSFNTVLMGFLCGLSLYLEP